MSEKEKMEPEIKLWLQKGEESIGGEGRIKLLEEIKEENSLKKAAEQLGMSYRHAWGIIKELEEKLGQEVIESEKGGSQGGGSNLTEKGLKLINKYRWMNQSIQETIKKETFWENMSTKISARNNLEGKIEDIETGEVGAKIEIKVEPSDMTAFITKQSAEDMDLEEGDKIEAVIKSTEVMISKP